MVQAAILWVILLLIFSPLPAQAKEAGSRELMRIRQRVPGCRRI